MHIGVLYHDIPHHPSIKSMIYLWLFSCSFCDTYLETYFILKFLLAFRFDLSLMFHNEFRE